MSKEIQIKQECCDIWNNLKDKSKMIDYLFESKQKIANLEAKLTKKDKELKQKNKTIKRLTKYNDELANALIEKPEQLELYQLREDNKVLSMNRDNYVNAELKEQRHQICEKIRVYFIKANSTFCGRQASREDIITTSAYNECLNDLRKFLYQIEKGE